MTTRHALRLGLALLAAPVCPACAGDDAGEGAEEASGSESSSASSSSTESSESTESESELESESTESTESESESTGSESSGATATTSSETEDPFCSVSGWDVGPEPEQCVIFVSCQSEMDHQINCSAEGCDCIGNGVVLGSCGDPAGICATPDDMMHVFDCCGL